jgi:replication factor C subunit 3/5
MASPHLTAEAVYLCTGNPMPKDIEQIAFWLLNESFSTSYQKISEMKTRKGLALFDVVRELQPFVFSIDMPPAVRIQLIDALADIE